MELSQTMVDETFILNIIKHSFYITFFDVFHGAPIFGHPAHTGQRQCAATATSPAAAWVLAHHGRLQGGQHIGFKSNQVFKENFPYF